MNNVKKFFEKLFQTVQLVNPLGFMIELQRNREGVKS